MTDYFLSLRAEWNEAKQSNLNNNVAFALRPCGKPIVANSERRKKHDNKVAYPKNAKKHNNKGFQPIVLTIQKKAHKGLKPLVIKIHDDLKK